MTRAIALLSIMIMLAGCSTPGSQQTHRQSMTPAQQAQALTESQRRADILRVLPADADFENINEQIRLHELEQYIDIYGARRSLNEPVTVKPQPARITTPVHMTEPKTRSVRQAPTPTTTESISFDPLPPPIDILKGSAR